MSEPLKTTPGPWQACHCGCGQIRSQHPDRGNGGFHVGEMASVRHLDPREMGLDEETNPPHEERDGNACLAAAAPEMRDALRLWQAYARHYFGKTLLATDPKVIALGEAEAATVEALAKADGLRRTKPPIIGLDGMGRSQQ